MEALLCQEGLDVNKTFIDTDRVVATVDEEGDVHYQHTHRAYVFYQWGKDKVIEETHRLQKLAQYAKQIRDDDTYKSLKNAKQREMHLLAFHGLCSKDAAEVIELAKDEAEPIMNKLISTTITEATA